MPFRAVFGRPRRVILNPDAHRAAKCKATCTGGISSLTATIWLAALTVAFTVTLGGLAGVEDCLKKEISPPPPHPPPPPPPPTPSPPHLVCTNILCRIGHADGRCQQMCNTAACGYDGGDCVKVASSSSGSYAPGATGAVRPTMPSTVSHRPTTLGDLLQSMGAHPAGRRSLKNVQVVRGKPQKSKRMDSYSYSYDGDDSYDSYDSEDGDDDDDDDDHDDHDDDERGGGDGRHGGRDEPPDFLREASREVITPMLSLVGTFGFLGAVSSLVSGILSLCGAASSSTLILKGAAGCAGLAAVGGLLLTVGSGVVGGLLVSGGEMLHVVMEREFPVRAARCSAPISHYAFYVGSSLLSLAAACAVGACAAVANLDAACKLAAVCAVTGPAEDTSEQLSLVAGCGSASSVGGFISPATNGRGGSGRPPRTLPRRSDVEMPQAVEMQSFGGGAAYGMADAIAMGCGGGGASNGTAKPADDADDSIFPPVPPPVVNGTPLQPPPACGGV
jgi:hypothetical protein